MESTQLTPYGRVVSELLAEHGLSLEGVADIAAEIGYPFDPEIARRYMHDSAYRCQVEHTNVCQGVGEALSVDNQTATRLAVAWVFQQER